MPRACCLLTPVALEYYCTTMSTPADIAAMTEAAVRLELQRQKEKAEAERENSLQEEVNRGFWGYSSSSSSRAELVV